MMFLKAAPTRSAGQHLSDDFVMLVNYAFGEGFWNVAKIAMIVIQVVVLLVIVRAVLGSFETTEPSHPWMPRRMAVKKGFVPVFALVATTGLALAGVKAVSENTVPMAFWWALPFLAAAGWIAAYHVLRRMRKDILGVPAIDALLAAAPASAIAWLAVVGYWTSSIPVALVLLCMLAAIGLFIMWPRKEA
jgi:hypothetical protein